MPTAKSERSLRGEIHQSRASLGLLSQILLAAPGADLALNIQDTPLGFRARNIDTNAKVHIDSAGDGSYRVLVRGETPVGRETGLIGAIRFITPDMPRSGFHRIESFFLLQVKNPSQMPMSDDIEPVLLQADEIVGRNTIPARFQGNDLETEAYRFLADKFIHETALKDGALTKKRRAKSASQGTIQQLIQRLGISFD